MSEKKTFYIERLLSEIKSLQESVLEVNNSGILPFSFFKESFNKTQKITEILHDLEFMQVDDLKSQMERLVVVLSEKERKEQEAAQEKEKEKEYFLSKVKDLQLQEDREQVLSKTNDRDVEKLEIQSGNIHSEGLVLPEYRNPYISDDNQIKKVTDSDNKVRKSIADIDNAPKSINDIIKTPPAVVDLKRGISLNDRFLFQRELFGNDRHRMNSTIEKLNNFESYNEAEDYIRENVTADLDNPTVTDFLSIVKKGFK